MHGRTGSQKSNQESHRESNTMSVTMQRLGKRYATKQEPTTHTHTHTHTCQPRRNVNTPHLPLHFDGGRLHSTDTCVILPLSIISSMPHGMIFLFTGLRLLRWNFSKTAWPSTAMGRRNRVLGTYLAASTRPFSSPTRTSARTCSRGTWRRCLSRTSLGRYVNQISQIM